jgi:hypothetical protein
MTQSPYNQLLKVNDVGRGPGVVRFGQLSNGPFCNELLPYPFYTNIVFDHQLPDTVASEVMYFGKVKIWDKEF